MNNKSGGGFACAIKGSFLALFLALLLVLIFAFLLKWTSIPESIITPVNEVIKGVSIFLGVFLGLKNQKEKGLVLGAMIGLLFTMLAFVIFSVLSCGFVFDKSLLFDTVFGCIIGGICGIICVNLKRY